MQLFESGRVGRTWQGGEGVSRALGRYGMAPNPLGSERREEELRMRKSWFEQQYGG